MSDPLANVLRCAAALEEAQMPHVLVTIISVRGSAPQDVSSKMLVEPSGRTAGTVGGGKIEATAIRRATNLLSGNADATMIETWDLKRDIGMTCGGTVSLLFEARATKPWTVAIFGAGHISQTLTRVLLPLPVRLEVCDPRPDWIAQLPTAPNLHQIVEARPENRIAHLPPDAFVICLTQGHQTDFPVLEKALRRGFPFIGVIGSRAKAATLRRELREAGIDPATAKAFHCPLGLDLGTNHPQEIAISIAAQLLLERDR